MKSAFAVCLALALAQPAAGGAWLEKPGQGFAAASVTFRQAGGRRAHELSYYGAYGITQKLTLGADLNQTADDSGHALIFARLPLRQGRRYRLALETAAGGNHVQGLWHIMQKTTLSYGRGINTARHTGWLALDAAYELRNSGRDAVWKLDAAAGLHRPGKLAPMLQVETSKPENGRFSYTLRSAVRYPLSRQQELVLGLEYRSAGQQSLGLRPGLWQRF
ncbi:hypothetical protein [Leisingera sp. ANG-Vp]|uniref:hypothetical protein n=1 Tax=Leisingera sp. ANG-Vp TaxID=1577896 RepID=UPI00069148CD|nr:hypothetical protein [Leisingera sp. ANG-Vp]